MSIVLNHMLDLPNVEISTFSFVPFDSRMYVLLHHKQCVIIDPAHNEEVLPYLQSKCVEEIIILLTHEHFDHLTGVHLLKDNFPCKIICSNTVSQAINDPKKNLSFYHDFMTLVLSDTHRLGSDHVELRAFTCEADVSYKSNYEVFFARYVLKLCNTPGHSRGSCCMVLYDLFNNPLCIFTGDSLMKDYPTYTNLPGGSKRTFNIVTKPFFLTMPDNLIIYPGHGEDAVLSEIKYRLNE
jgi:hydroxyacylglutathione hydrolase